MARQAIGSDPWTGPGDRFMREGYRDALPREERLRRIADLRTRGLIEGFEMKYPFDVSEETLPQLKEFLIQNDLALAALGTPVSSSRQFGHGSLTARDPAVRRDAIDRVMRGMDICAELGGDRVYFFLGQDGCDYPLEIDYEYAWDAIIEGISEIAAHRRDIKVCLEYKPYEPRRRIFLNNVGISLWLIDQVGADNVGVVFDVGHAMMVDENLGESIYLLSRAGCLFHVHFTDNYRTFDDDMIVGAVHLMPFIEAVYWLKRVGYTGWQSLDLYPYREDPDVAVVQSIRLLRRLEACIDEIGLEAISKLLEQGDGGQSLRVIYEHLIRA